MLRKTPRDERGSYESLKRSSRQQTGSFRRKSDKSISRQPGEMIDNTLFCRYELKYRIGESQAAMIEEFIRPYLDLDYYSQLKSGGAYAVAGLYLDSPDLQLCRETLDGKKNRFKLRVRSYSDDLNAPCFFEIKRRINDVIIKSRAQVRRQDVAALLSGRFLPLPNYTNEEALKQFQLYVSYINARPVVRIRYLRRAYQGDSHNRVRVTFDREIFYKTTGKPNVSLGGQGWHRIPLNFVVLEIKFTAHYPAWLSRMVKCLNLQRKAISKYASSIKQSCSLGYCAPPLLVW